MKSIGASVDIEAAVDRRSPQPADPRYVLAIGDEASAVADLDGITVVRRLPNVALVLADASLAAAISDGRRTVHVYGSRDDALRAFSLFTLPEG
jgi:hypothetical protein